jgi:poly(A) polymerase
VDHNDHLEHDGEPSLRAFIRAPERVFAWALSGATSGRPRVVAAIRREVARLIGVPPRLLVAGLDAALRSADVPAALHRLQELGAIAVCLPEVEALVDFHQSCSVHHKDLWEHTVAVVAKCPMDLDIRWAALLHDTGKIATRAVDASGKVTFLRHEGLGARLAIGVTARLEMDPARAQRIAFIIGHHGRINAYEPSWSDRAVRRLMADAGEGLSDLLAFSSADYTTKRTRKAARIQSNLADLVARIGAQRAAEAAPRLPSGMGDLIARRFGLSPGPEIGARIARLEAMITAGEVAADATPEALLNMLGGSAQKV